VPRTDTPEARLRRLVAAAAPAPGFLSDHDVVLRPAGGRNAAVVVEVDGEPRWVAKPSRAGEASGEGAFLRGLAGGSLRDVVPRVHHDGGDGLVTAHAGGVPADTVPGLASGHLAALGRFLAALHDLPVADGGSRPPWITRLHRPSPRRLSRSPAAVVGLVREVQAHDGICAVLDDLAARWRPDVLTHGDMRLANVLLGDAARITVVDWEAAGPGPPALDLGWVAGDLLLRWALALDPGAPSEPLALRSGGPALHRACSGIAEVLDAYGPSRPDPLPVMGWAGARLLQAAAEACQAQLFAPPEARMITMAARLVLTRTDAFADRVAAVR